MQEYLYRKFIYKDHYKYLYLLIYFSYKEDLYFIYKEDYL